MKIVESSVVPSVFVTVHVSVPQDVKPLTLDTEKSVKLRTATSFFTIYVKAGEANFAPSRVKVSERHVFDVTKILKSYV